MSNEKNNQTRKPEPPQVNMDSLMPQWNSGYSAQPPAHGMPMNNPMFPMMAPPPNNSMGFPPPMMAYPFMNPMQNQQGNNTMGGFPQPQTNMFMPQMPISSPGSDSSASPGSSSMNMMNNMNSMNMGYMPFRIYNSMPTPNPVNPTKTEVPLDNYKKTVINSDSEDEYDDDEDDFNLHVNNEIPSREKMEKRKEKKRKVEEEKDEDALKEVFSNEIKQFDFDSLTKNEIKTKTTGVKKVFDGSIFDKEDENASHIPGSRIVSKQMNALNEDTFGADAVKHQKRMYSSYRRNHQPRRRYDNRNHYHSNKYHNQNNNNKNYHHNKHKRNHGGRKPQNDGFKSVPRRHKFRQQSNDTKKPKKSSTTESQNHNHFEALGDLE